MQTNDTNDIKKKTGLLPGNVFHGKCKLKISNENIYDTCSKNFHILPQDNLTCFIEKYNKIRKDIFKTFNNFSFQENYKNLIFTFKKSGTKKPKYSKQNELVLIKGMGSRGKYRFVTIFYNKLYMSF